MDGGGSVPFRRSPAQSVTREAWRSPGASAPPLPLKGQKGCSSERRGGGTADEVRRNHKVDAPGPHTLAPPGRRWDRAAPRLDCGLLLRAGGSLELIGVHASPNRPAEVLRAASWAHWSSSRQPSSRSFHASRDSCSPGESGGPALTTGFFSGQGPGRNMRRPAVPLDLFFLCHVEPRAAGGLVDRHS
jgi:hypothetical protein